MKSNGELICKVNMNDILLKNILKNRLLLPIIQRRSKHFICGRMMMEKLLPLWIFLLRELVKLLVAHKEKKGYDKLEERMKEMHIPAEELWWYLDTRRFGTVPHAGFGLGFERMVQFVTGMTNIRDVIAFPRTPKNAEF